MKRAPESNETGANTNYTDWVIKMFFSPLPSVHELKSLIDLLKGKRVGHKLVHLQLLTHVVFHQFGNALHTFPPWR